MMKQVEKIFKRSNSSGVDTTEASSQKVSKTGQDESIPLLCFNGYINSNRQRHIFSLFWIEKLFLFIDYFQLYGLLFQASQPWGYPFLWSTWTQWTLAFNLDIFSFTKNGSLIGQTSSLTDYKWGYMDNYLNYALLYSIIPFLVGICSFSVLFYSSNSNGDSSSSSSDDSNSSYSNARYFHSLAVLVHACNRTIDQYKHFVIQLLVLASMIFYLPSNLAVFRLYYCNQSGLLSADPSVVCWSPVYTAYFTFSTLMQLLYICGLPYVLHRYVSDTVVYQLPCDHDKKIQSWELQYLLNIDDDWIKLQTWITSSFNRYGCYYYIHMAMFKLILLIVFIFFRFDSYTQGSLMWCIIVSFSVYYCLLNPPFRCVSSNILLCVLMAVLTVNASFALMNCYGLQNLVMVASNETIWLLSFNCFGLLLILILFISIVYMNRCNRRYYCSYWPVMVTISSLIEHNGIETVTQWIDALHQANKAKRIFMLSPIEITPIAPVDASMKELRRCWIQAKRHGSIFESILSDALEEMLIICNRKLSIEQQEINKNINEDSLKILVQLANSRDDAYAMWGTRKRRIINKLTSMNTITSRTIQQRMQVLLDTVQNRSNAIAKTATSTANINSILSEIINMLIAKSNDVLQLVKYRINSTAIGYNHDLDHKLHDLYVYWDTIIDVIESDAVRHDIGNDVKLRIDDYYVYRCELSKYMLDGSYTDAVDGNGVE